MKRHGTLLFLLAAGLAGCDPFCLLRLFHKPPPPPALVREYRARGFDWNAVSRVLLLPLVNETAFPHVAEEVRAALAAELQALGRFEVVNAPHDLNGCLVQQVRVEGRFNEFALVELARLCRADVIVLGTVTNYSPYPPPRLGLAIQVVSPFDAVVVASVDGLWDAAVKGTADQARLFHREGLAPRQVWMSGELVLDSPRLYQRFVCGQAARAVAGP